MSGIPYVTKSWNPAVGCKECSPGCAHCWAKRMAHRQHIEWGQITTKPERLDQPLHWRKPQIVAVGFMSDIALWPDEFLDKVFAMMALTPQHTYVLLTKRPERMRGYLVGLATDVQNWPLPTDKGSERIRVATIIRSVATWPLPNVWLGVSVENQQAADERIPLLLDTPAAHRWLSVEPLLGAVDLRRVSPGLLGTSAIFDALGGRRWEDNGETLNATACARLDWVVVGGESGPKARTMDVEWMSDLQQQCLSADVPFYCKQDSGPRPGMQGRILDALWAVKQLPGGWA